MATTSSAKPTPRRTWHSKFVGDDAAAARASAILRERIAELTPIPKGLVVLVQAHGALSTTFYFSPEASALADALGAVPCAKPTPNANTTVLFRAR